MTLLEDLRDRLNPMTGRIVYRLWQRSQLPLNLAVYKPGEVRWAQDYDGEKNQSLLDFTVRKLEETQALLGKYTFSEQQPFSGGNLPKPVVERKEGTLVSIPPFVVPVREEILTFHQTILPRICKEGDDPETYGITAYTDADLLLWVNERTNHGKHVAYAKASDEKRFHLREVKDDPVELHRKLQDLEREAQVKRTALIWAEALNSADRLSATLVDALGAAPLEKWEKKHPLEPQRVTEFLNWLIMITTDVQVKYLQADNVQRALGWRG